CNGLEAPGPPSSTSLFALSHSFPIQFLKVFEAQQSNGEPNRTGLIARAEAQKPHRKMPNHKSEGHQPNRESRIARYDAQETKSRWCYGQLLSCRVPTFFIRRYLPDCSRSSPAEQLGNTSVLCKSL